MHSLFLVEATKSEVQSQYTKPKMSYAQLIAEALLTGSERMLTLNDIYIAINKQHPYYSLDAASGRNWQNAIRLVKLLEIFSRDFIGDYSIQSKRNLLEKRDIVDFLSTVVILLFFSRESHLKNSVICGLHVKYYSAARRIT